MNRLNTRIHALKWMIDAIRPWFGPENTGAAPDFHRGLPNWEAVSRLAYIHNLEPLLYQRTLTGDLDAFVPGHLYKIWERAYFGNVIRNEEYLKILGRFLKGCAESNLPVIVLKGPALIARLYKDPGRRMMSDLDILCSPGDLDALTALACDIGFFRMPVEDSHSAHHAVLQEARSGVILELHFQPYPQIQHPQRFMKWAWQGRHYIELDGWACPVLSLEMSLIFNVAHLIQHHFDVSLKHYLDIAALHVFFETELDWDRIYWVVAEAGLEQAFRRTIHFVFQIVGRPLPCGRFHKEADMAKQASFNDSLLAMLSLMDERPLKLDHVYQGGWKDLLKWAWELRFELARRKSPKEQMGFIRSGLTSLLGDLSPVNRQSEGVPDKGGSGVCRTDFFYLFRLLLNGHMKLAIERTAAKNRVIQRTYTAT